MKNLQKDEFTRQKYKMKPKDALDKIIKKSRVHFYKPIQVAEILHHHRTKGGLDLTDLESYRNISKRWRDKVSSRLIGRVSTSSQKYQDNLFERNAIPPALLSKLGNINKKGNGFVEVYIYQSLKTKLSSVYTVGEYIEKTDPKTFTLRVLVALFTKTPGLRRSIDKMYEIAVYALFSAIVRALNVQVTLEIKNKDKEILRDFEKFTMMVLGVDVKKTRLTIPASLFRVGVTNAADRGLDMWANFGPAVQVKHLTLTPELAEGITEEIRADRIVIVCLDAEKHQIGALLKQVGWGNRIQGIVALSDLEKWYQLCLSDKYRKKLGKNLIKNMQREFEAEFPSVSEIDPFLKERGYDEISLPPGWEIDNST